MADFLSFGPRGWGDELFLGFCMTIALGVCVFLIGLVIGLFLTAAKVFYGRYCSYLVKAYTTVFRGLPELLILYYFFFFLPDAVSFIVKSFGYMGVWSVEPFFIAVISLSLVAGAYFTEAFRGAIDAIPKEQIESCQALGMSSSRTFWKIVVPQMIANGIDYINNIWQYVFKDTSLASLVGVVEIMRVAQIADRVEFEPVIIFGVVIVYFLVAYFIAQRVFVLMRRYFISKGEIYQKMEKISYL